VKAYDGPASDVDIAYDIAHSPDGSRVFVTGRSTGHSSGDDYATVAYDSSTGAKVWGKRWSGIGSDAAYSIAVGPDGSRVFVTGGSTGNTGDDYATVAYDASSGAELWVRRYNGPGDGFDDANSVAASGSEVFVTGGSAGPSTGSDYATVAYDASTGARLWVKRYDGRGSGTDYASSVAVSPDGSTAFVTGESAGVSTGLDYATVAYDAFTGTRRWVKRYKGPGDGFDYALSLAVTPDGSRVFVTGESAGVSTGLDYATVAYDASTGARLWMRRYNGPGDGGDFASSVAVSPDGSKVFLTGGSTGTISYNYATVAYDVSTGTTLWIRRYGGGSDAGSSGAIASSVTVSPNGSKVYVTGGSASDSGNWNYATVAYDAITGANLWANVRDGPANGYDDALSIAASPDGSRVFVTGESTGSTTGEDYATVAYTA
jgi:hypothetical protein